MNTADFWNDIKVIIANGFDAEGLQKLDYYAELFVRGKFVYKRFSPKEQYGCAKGGSTNVIATLLAGAKSQADPNVEGDVRSFKGQIQLGAQQEAIIEQWSRFGVRQSTIIISNHYQLLFQQVIRDFCAYPKSQQFQ